MADGQGQGLMWVRVSKGSGYTVGSDYPSVSTNFLQKGSLGTRSLFVGYCPWDRSWISALSDVLALWTDRRTHAIAAALRRPALHLPRALAAAERHACARLDADDERRHQREHRQGEPEGRLSHSKRSLRRASSPAALRASSSALLCAASSSPLRLLSSASCRRCSFACCRASRLLISAQQ